MSHTAKWTGFDASPAFCVVIVCLCVQSKEFRQLLSCASLLWRAPTCQSFLQFRRYSEVDLGLCQLGHKMRRPTRILLANVDPCDTDKIRRTCHGVNFTCSRSGSAHRKTSEPAPGRLPAEICHFLVQALMAEPHARFSLNKHTPVTSPREHHFGSDLGCWSIVVPSARFLPRRAKISARLCLCLRKNVHLF